MQIMAIMLRKEPQITKRKSYGLELIATYSLDHCFLENRAAKAPRRGLATAFAHCGIKCLSNRPIKYSMLSVSMASFH